MKSFKEIIRFAFSKEEEIIMGDAECFRNKTYKEIMRRANRQSKKGHSSISIKNLEIGQGMKEFLEEKGFKFSIDMNFPALTW